jgi:hypothetical protein
MKALTLLQPWAMLLVAGPKRTETRSWNTTHRGPLFVHASQKVDEDRQHLAWRDPFIRELCQRMGFATLESMPRGVIVGGVQLTDTHRFGSTPAVTYSIEDSRLGNFAPGRFGFCTEDPFHFSLSRMVAHRGYPNLWNVSPRGMSDLRDSLRPTSYLPLIQPFWRALERELGHDH